MDLLPKSLADLTAILQRLPSLGKRSAARLAYHFISNKELARDLAQQLTLAADSVKLCERCHFISNEGLCGICTSPHRDRSLICVVEKPSDVIAIEAGAGYTGLFHVLHGLWAPMRGKSESDIRLESLLKRIEDSMKSSNLDISKVTEVILATGITVDGDATALFVAKSLEHFTGLRITRLAQGLPKGADLEFADGLTVRHALMDRKRL